MEIATLIAAFGGGVFGSVIGGTTTFVFTGILGLIGIAVAVASGNQVILNEIAFGPFFGPHVAFVGGVAASAYLGRKKSNALKDAGLPTDFNLAQLDSPKYEGYEINNEYMSSLVDGADTLTPLFKSKDSMALVIGGIFGVFGHILNYLFADVLALPMDTIALVVVILGLATRFIFGSSGLFGSYPKDESRFKVVNQSLLFTIIWAAGVSAVTGYVVILVGIETVGFTISATSLIFLYFTDSFPLSHHVTMTAGYAAITFGNIWMPIVFGVLAVVLGEYTHRATNTYVDSHLDMPAVMIALWSIIILGIFG